ncbi:NAD-dependent epimerase/dehydratase family protein [Pseudomonas mandelii]|nr:NAD-dependent epimerase/dehydratase family protein [Pseudomonas mandelii]OYQ23321.1 hypothetical protein B7L09_08035 [Pseudomonas mandelii]
MSIHQQALVVGASGIIGNAVVESLVADSQWIVRALRHSLNPSVGSIDCDLTDAAATSAAQADVSDITHVFFAAYQPNSNALIEAQTNAAMLRNVLDGLKSAVAKVQRSASLAMVGKKQCMGLERSGVSADRTVTFV